MDKQFLRSGILAVCLLFAASALVAQDQNDEFQQLYNEYLEINQRLQTVQQQALQDENVAEQAEEYSKFVDSKLKGLDSRAAELVDQREATIDNIEAAQDDGDFESIQELQQDYEMITQELQPYMQQAMQDEEVQVRQQELESVLIAKMEEIDPDTVPLLNRMMEISEQIERMMQHQQE
jgi:hypothetical protein